MTEPREPGHGNPYANAEYTDADLVAWIHSRSRPLTSDHARPPGRPDAWRLFKPVTDVRLEGDLL
ncbi:hypothetical protein [Streptomyces sp. NPDC096339]|uniref:hypothetical protein n=1 Tax=Streptomyces sp. NPDC096339 TaxID=3366086 RepID=UPI00380156CA